MNSYDDIDSWLDRGLLIASRGMNLPMGPLAAGSLLKGHLFVIKDDTGNDIPGCIGTVFIVLNELHMQAGGRCVQAGSPVPAAEYRDERGHIEGQLLPYSKSHSSSTLSLWSTFL